MTDNIQEQKKQEEINRLCQIYRIRKREFDKAESTRLVLTWLGFAAVFCYILFSIYKPNSEDAFWIIVVCLMASLFYCFVNIGVFGLLAKRHIEENITLNDLEKRINDLTGPRFF